MTKTKYKILISNEQLQKLLSMLQGAITSKMSMQILANILIEVKNNFITFKATDTEVGIICKLNNATSNFISIETDKPFSLTVNLAKLITIIKTFPISCDLKLEYDEKDLLLSSVDKAYKTKHKLNVLAAEDYPDIPITIDGNSFEIVSEDLVNAIKKTSYAIPSDNYRQHLQGIHIMNNDKDKLDFITTDGSRLALYNSDQSIKSKIDVICPLKTLRNILTILGNSSTMCRLTYNETKLLLIVTINEMEITLTSNLVMAQYPDHTKVIPSSFDIEIEIDKDTLLRSMLSVTALLDKNVKQVILTFTKDKLILQSQNTEYGDSHDEIAIDYTGDEITLGFNGFYLLDILKIINDDIISFQKSNNELPIKIIGKNENDTHIVMPMRLAENF